jgi:Uncharacterised protein family (UPF0172)
MASEASATTSTSPSKGKKGKKAGAAAASVSVTPGAAVAMALHSVSHKTAAVHGVLIGSFLTDEVMVTTAMPVCHGPPPTLPIVETALGLIRHYCDKMNAATDEGPRFVVVGWYTAPMLLDDTQPGPVALRIAAQLATESNDSVLLVVQNQELAELIADPSEKSKSFVKALGRDFGDQWLEPIASTVVNDPELVSNVVLMAMEQGIILTDLVDHLENNDSNSNSATKELWYPTQDLINHITGKGLPEP